MDPSPSLRSAFPLVLVAVLAGSLAWAFYGDRGVLANRALQEELIARQSAVDERQTTVALLRVEIDQMKTDPLAQERWVREELGYVKPGEILYLFPSDQATDFEVVQDRRLREAQLPPGMGDQGAEGEKP
ncbi:MAG: septum formation initiator family protein [Deltaproteobacteria bacterium]|nr:septum formation initiator family protein [Deltaproteobacteria bacterium]